MVRKIGVTFYLMTPFYETTRLRRLLSCFLSALQLNDRYKSQKTAENTTIFTLYYYINLQKEKKSQGLQ